MDWNKANREASDKAETLREEARLASCAAMALARKCKKGKDGELPSPEVKKQASELGKQAWESRRIAKAAEAEAASARRIACFKSLPAKVVPEIPKGPLAPPPRKPLDIE